MFAINSDFDPPCRDERIDPDRFFSNRKKDIEWAKRVCGSCRIQLLCLHNALEYERISGERQHGIQGGLTEEERAQTQLTRIA
jgi:hypothetical protein